MKSLTILIALALCGCAATPQKAWRKVNGPTPSPEQVLQEAKECDYEAAKATANMPQASTNDMLANAIVTGSANPRLTELAFQCMNVRGYHLTTVQK